MKHRGKQETDKTMLEIVVCKDCGRPEYYGMMHWLNGKQHCRKCTYMEWILTDSFGWHPTETDYVFPLYADGLDYREVAEDE